MKLSIIDYGAGNVANVRYALERIGTPCQVSADPIDWTRSDALIFPGVGAFGAAMKQLGERAQALRDCIRQGKPFLGICLGMQLLMDSSEESPGVDGLGVWPGEVKRLRTRAGGSRLPVPQIGWNEVECVRATPLWNEERPFYAYFVHSYYCEPKKQGGVVATAVYGMRFPAMLQLGSLFATQFHPEKSGADGERILRNFIQEAKR